MRTTFSCQEYFCTFFRVAPCFFLFYALFSLSFRPVSRPSHTAFRQSLCAPFHNPIQLVVTFLRSGNGGSSVHRALPSLTVAAKTSFAPPGRVSGPEEAKGMPWDTEDLCFLSSVSGPLGRKRMTEDGPGKEICRVKRSIASAIRAVPGCSPGNTPPIGRNARCCVRSR